MIQRVRERAGDERGVTLVELVVSVSILGIVMVAILSVLTTVQKAAVRQDLRGQTNDQARLALQSLDRTIRSGNLLYSPASETPAYFRIRVYTQSNAPTLGDRCVLWEINTSQQLVTRSWPANQPEDATSWQVVANGIVNRALSPTVNAFSVDASGRTVTAVFRVNADLTNYSSQTETLKAAITGRNTSFGYPADVCADLPT
jgi:prepilin-type N-terminal cleavage/methylation domain-containing protein